MFKKVWSWTDAALIGRVQVASKLEVACYQAHLAHREGSFELLELELSELSAACWQVAGAFVHGTLGEALEESSGPIWVRREAIYRERPVGKATRQKHSQRYVLQLGAQCGLVSVNPRLHAAEVRLYAA